MTQPQFTKEWIEAQTAAVARGTKQLNEMPLAVRGTVRRLADKLLPTPPEEVVLVAPVAPTAPKKKRKPRTAKQKAKAKAKRDAKKALKAKGKAKDASKK